MTSNIGRRLPRREDKRLLTGRGRFAADGHRPGLLHLAFRRAEVPGGEGLRVDLAVARSMPGVVGAWRAADLSLADPFMPHLFGADPPERRPVLATGRVRFEGEAVAVVAAQSEYQAMDAVDAIQVDVDEAALERPEITTRHGFGDAEVAFEGAPVTVRGRVGMAQISGGAIEPRACLAEWFPEEDRLEIRATVGWVHGLRAAVAGCLGLEVEQVTALAEDVGGSFGAKNHPYPEYIVAAALARQLGHPVRWVAVRTEDSLTTAQAHGAVLDLEVAAEADGRLRGIRGEIDWPVGAYVTHGAMMSHGYASHMVSAYRLPALDLNVRARVSTGPASMIRGGGRPVGNYGSERMMDRLARRIGLDPIELRRLNLVPAEAMPYETGFPGQVYDGRDYERLLRLATERAGHAEIRERQRTGEPLGLGVAMCVESTGGLGVPEPSRVLVHADGRTEVFVGSTPQGQGHETFLAQVAADRLGWPLERVAVHAGDSRNVPFAMVTAGSRSALEVGNSVALSASSARRQLLERAADTLEAAPNDIELGVEGAVVRGARGRGVPLETLVGEGLVAVEAWTSNGPAWASSCHVAIVRLDLETGGVEMGRYIIAHDSGRPINPLLLDGQLHGGYAHGLGYALFEECVYSEDGSFVGPSFLDYTIASAPELAVEPELIHTETPTSQNPEGFRGVGEAGTIAVPAAIANAIEDALHAAGRPVEVDMVPVTQLRLWELLRNGT